MTRVSDYHHRLVDVLSGIFLGGLVGLIGGVYSNTINCKIEIDEDSWTQEMFIPRNIKVMIKVINIVTVLELMIYYGLIDIKFGSFTEKNNALWYHKRQ